jgi:endonuclease-3
VTFVGRTKNRTSGRRAFVAESKRKSAAAKRRANAVRAALADLYPDAHCALIHADPLQLLVATILSAQCTDAMVNKVTPALFEKYPTAQDFANADLPELEAHVKSTGFYRNKAKNIQAACKRIVEHHAGRVPGTMEELLKLPGVARKTANVVLGECFATPGITVDTHVGRLSRRMGLTTEDDPVKVERDLQALTPNAEWTIFSHRMIYHGRQVCAARKPNCGACTLARVCPKIGVEG